MGDIYMGVREYVTYVTTPFKSRQLRSFECFSKYVTEM